MSKAGVFAKTCTYEELSAIAEQLRTTRQPLSTYIEQIERRPFVYRDEIVLSESFLTLRIFGELCELHVKPATVKGLYRVVFITDDVTIMDEKYILLEAAGERSVFWEKSNEKLILQYYKSEKYGDFMRWKGLIKDEKSSAL
jgi:hypothetical protein